MAEPQEHYAFGPIAQRWAARLPAGISAVIADESDSARALERAVNLRMSGTEFYTAILLDEPRAAVAAFLAYNVITQVSDLDARRSLFDQIAAETLQLDNGGHQRNIQTVGAPALKTLCDLYTAADHVLTRSWTEHQRLGRIFGAYRSDTKIFAPKDPTVPISQRGGIRGEGIVIWAPHAPSASVALIAFALEELMLPVTVVSADGFQLPLRARFTKLEEGAAALQRALIIVDASLSDPGPAIALSELGLPIAAAITSGAHEDIERAYLFDPWNWRSVYAATTAALAGLPARPRPGSQTFTLHPPERLAGAPLADPPLVSVLTPTYNRRERLAKSLRRWERQTYRNFEVSLVNDGGEPVDDIAAGFAFVRLTNLQTNEGIPRAINASLANARGKYIFFGADDDLFAPDLIESMVYALERTGCTVAHCNVVMRHEEAIENDGHRVSGYTLEWCRALDPTRAQFTGDVLLGGTMIRTQALRDLGGYDEELKAMRDMHTIMSLSERYAFAHVDKTLVVYVYRSDPSSYSFKNRTAIYGDSLDVMFAKHPTERASVVAGRNGVKQYFANHDPVKPYWVPAIRLESPLQDED